MLLLFIPPQIHNTRLRRRGMPLAATRVSSVEPSSSHSSSYHLRPRTASSSSSSSSYFSIEQWGGGWFQPPPSSSCSKPARWSAARQFNVVPDRCGITHQVLRFDRTRFRPSLVYVRNTDEPGLISRWLLWTGRLISPEPPSADAWQGRKGI
jgi:hypothetical protein